MIQGLLGRCTGYDDTGHTNIFTNINSIIKYHKLWSSGFDDRSIKWYSKTTKYNRGELTGDNTFNNPLLYQGFEHSTPIPILPEPIIKKFIQMHEAINFYKNNLRSVFLGSGPRGHYNVNDDGFNLYLLRNICKVWSCDDIYNQRRSGLGVLSNFKLIPCYRDVNDNSTLEWWLIYRRLDNLN